MAHGGVSHDRPAGQRESACRGVGGADEPPIDECADSAAGFAQLADLLGLQVWEGREPHHGGAEHFSRRYEVVLGVEDTDVGGHQPIMSRALRRGA